jgi:hypothetical protein
LTASARPVQVDDEHRRLVEAITDGDPQEAAAHARDHDVVVEGKPVLNGSADPAFRGTPETIADPAMVERIEALHKHAHDACRPARPRKARTRTSDHTGLHPETGAVGR